MSTEEEEETPACPCCGNPGTSLGALGSLAWWRCRGCGVDYSTNTKSEETT